MEYKIVSIGGGTGLSSILKSLKEYTKNLTAIVTVADDGGGSGILRDDLNMLPPGDIRNCIMALADSEPLMDELIRYRFSDGSLKGQSFGNLLLAAMTGICSGDFLQAVKNVSNVLKVKGTVLPVTESNVKLAALLKNGEKVYGESLIGKSTQSCGCKIDRVWLENKCQDSHEPIRPLKEAIASIKAADVITLGPGSLYTSIIPNLIVPGIKEAIYTSKAPVIYINNIMTQPGETDGYTAFDHFKAITDHTYIDFMNYCIVNDGMVSEDVFEKYRNDGADLVENDVKLFEGYNVNVIQDDMISLTKKGQIRHNGRKLAEIIFDIIKREKC